MQKAKEVTIYDLADELNLSTATISRALKDDPIVSKKTRKLIFELAEKRGYRSNLFARNLRSQKTNTIGLMVHELQSNFINSVLAGVEKVTTAAGYDLIIAHSSECYTKELSNANNLFHKRVDGLIASLSSDTRDMRHFKPFTEKEVPVIFFDRVERNSDYPAVVIDNYKAGYQATKHLIQQGCSRIAHVTSSLVRNVYSERFRGYRDALDDNNIPFDDSLLIVNDLSEKAGLESGKKILEMDPRPDGVFITNDFVAASCMLILKQHIRVPEDIAVVGFNNDAIGHLVEPALTTINYPGEEMGEVAARVLIDHLKGVGNVDQISTIIINSGLVVRKSSLKSQGI